MYAIQLDAVSCTPSDDGMMHFSTGVYITNVGITAVDVLIAEGSTGAQISDAIREAIITLASQYGITLPPEKVVTNSYTTG
jgi:hypothetical protein